MAADYRLLRAQLTQLAQDTNLTEELLVDIFEKALFASDSREGKAIFVQRKDDILQMCGAAGFDPKSDLLPEARQRQVTEISPEDFLDFARGDQAFVLSSSGLLIGVNVPFSPPNDALVTRVPGTGSRHQSAQMVTSRTDALAIVVSDDGYICVFQMGALVLSHLLPNADNLGRETEKS